MILLLLAMAPVDPLAGAVWTARLTGYPAGCAREAVLAVEGARGDLRVGFAVSPDARIVPLGGDVPILVAREEGEVTARAVGGALALARHGDALAVHAVVDRWAGRDLQITGFAVSIPVEIVAHPTCPGDVTDRRE